MKRFELDPQDDGQDEDGGEMRHNEEMLASFKAALDAGGTPHRLVIEKTSRHRVILEITPEDEEDDADE